MTANDAGNASPKPGRQIDVGRFKLRNAPARGVIKGRCSGLNDSSIVVDCGANAGAVSVPLARTRARVIAFEPDVLALPAGQASQAGRGPRVERQETPYRRASVIDHAINTAANAAILQEPIVTGPVAPTPARSGCPDHPDAHKIFEARAKAITLFVRVDRRPRYARQIEAVPDMLGRLKKKGTRNESS